MIKAILFDMGGVLVNLDMQRCKDTFKRRCGYDRIDEVLDPCHQRGPFMRMEHGEISEGEFIAECLADSRPGTTPKDVRDSFWTIIGDLEPYKADLLNELAKDYPLYMLSNNNPIVMRRIGRLFRKAGIPLDTTFRKLFISCRMRMLKPTPEIFAAAVKGTGVKACECLFIDDSPTNVAAAESAGMHAALYVQGTDLRKTVYDKLSTIA